MIILLSSKLPQGLSMSEMSVELNKLFPACGNSDYFTGKLHERSEEGSRESLYALLLLSKAMDMLPSRVDKSVLAFDTVEGGKPCFKQSNIRFNLSHSKGYVACCVSDECDVGVDIEASIIPHEKAIKLAKRYFSEDEMIAVERSPESFTRIWSEKEAESKFHGGDLAVFLKERKQNSRTKVQTVRLHSFCINNIPITVCASGKFSTILFKIIQ